jgi:hypothetical protein
LIVDIGIAATRLTVIYVGFIGDIAVFPKECNGFRMGILQFSQNILNQFIAPLEVL